jgi:hypothetical protein
MILFRYSIYDVLDQTSSLSAFPQYLTCSWPKLDKLQLISIQGIKSIVSSKHDTRFQARWHYNLRIKYQPSLENKLKNVLNTIAFTRSHLSAGLQPAYFISRVTWTHVE